MKIHTFIAEDVTAALQQVEEALGKDAVIISNNKDGKQVRVIAALEDDLPPELLAPKTPPTPDQQAIRNKVELVLKFHKIPGKIVDEMMAKIAGQVFVSDKAALEKMMQTYFRYESIDSTKNSRIMLFGLPGIGKTLAVSKLMAQAVFNDNPVHVITTDIKRAGGVEQLTAFTKILKLKLHLATNPEQLQEKLAEIEGGMVLIDSFGINPYEQSEIDALAELLANEGIEPILAMPAGSDVEEAVEMAKAFRNLGAKRMIVTKADSVRRFGSIITVARIMNLALANFSGTPNVAKTLEAVSPEAMANLLAVEA